MAQLAVKMSQLMRTRSFMGWVTGEGGFGIADVNEQFQDSFSHLGIFLLYLGAGGVAEREGEQVELFVGEGDLVVHGHSLEPGFDDDGVIAG